MKSINAKLLKAVDPDDLINQVNIELQRGNDLYTPLFTSDEGLLCQFVIPMLGIYEYKLVVADDLDDLETQTNNLLAFGFDFLYSVVMWCGKYLQWMSRMNETGETLKEALVNIMTPADRDDETSLVVDVRNVLGLEPTAEFGIPFPVREDAERIGASYLHTLGLDIPQLLVVDGVVIS